MKSHVFVAILAAVPGVATAQSQPSSAPIVQVGIYGYHPDGTIGVSAFDTADKEPDLGTTLYLVAQSKRCGMGAGSRQPPPDATDAWQFTGKVISATSEEAVLQLNWRRLIVQGRAVNGDQSSTQLTLRAGESVQLDQATPGCETAAVTFEARYKPRHWSADAPSGVGGLRGSSAVSGGVSAGIVRGSQHKLEPGGGFGTTVPAPQAGGEGGGVKVAPGQGSGLFDVNLWLVRAVPGRPDAVTHTTLRMNNEAASFAFAPVMVPTNRGDAVVRVTGSLVVARGANGEDQLVFSTSRTVSPSANGQPPGDRSLDSQGTSRVVNRMPDSDEVLSFEMPPIAVGGKQVAPDQLSIRLKMSARR